MKLKTFEQYGAEKNYKEQLQKILDSIESKGYKYEDLYITNDSMSFNLIGKYPFSVHVGEGGDASIIVEENGITNKLVSYDINTEFDEIVETITDFK